MPAWTRTTLQPRTSGWPFTLTMSTSPSGSGHVPGKQGTVSPACIVFVVAMVPIVGIRRLVSRCATRMSRSCTGMGSRSTWTIKCGWKNHYAAFAWTWHTRLSSPLSPSFRHRSPTRSISHWRQSWPTATHASVGWQRRRLIWIEPAQRQRELFAMAMRRPPS